MAEGGGPPSKERGRGRGLPYGVPTQRQPLRQPMLNNSSRNTTSGRGPSEDILRSASVNDSASSQDGQVPEKKSSAPASYQLSPLAKEFIPRSTSNCHRSSSMRQPPVKDEVIQELEFQVEEMMTMLALNPGQFDLYVPVFLERVSDCTRLWNQNLRYNGARLCNYLAQNLISDTSDKIFRQLLLTRCQEEFDKREATLQANAHWMHGLVHFIGELFIHLELIGSDGNARKFEVLGTGLCHFLDLLLAHQNDDNLKCVGQFTGAVLEDEFHSKPDHYFEKVLAKVKDVSNNTNNNISPYIKEMLSKIAELRTCNWGRATSSPISKEEPFIGDFCCLSLQDDPVLYGPDGQPMSSEETQFLESNQYLYDGEDEYGDYSDFGQGEEWSAGDDQMTDEMAAAFEEFLAQQSNTIFNAFE
uniref:MIF4G domain-containing protein n=1 Tax=Strigamia maritima TaxID=126957 RepID=T1JMD5_STRMM